MPSTESLTTAIARPAARDESSARRAIAQPAPTGVNDDLIPKNWTV